MQSRPVNFENPLRVHLSMTAATQWWNLTADTLRYFGASDDVNFSHTATLGSVLVFDGAGNDISRFFTARLNNGLSLNTGPVLTATEAITELRNWVASEISGDVRDGLTDKLDAALSAFGKNKSPCGPPQAFANLVRAQSGKAVPTDTATVYLARLAQIDPLVEGVSASR